MKSKCFKWQHRWEYPPGKPPHRFRFCNKCYRQQAEGFITSEWEYESHNYGILYSRERLIAFLGQLGVINDPGERIVRIKFLT